MKIKASPWRGGKHGHGGSGRAPPPSSPPRQKAPGGPAHRQNPRAFPPQKKGDMQRTTDGLAGPEPPRPRVTYPRSDVVASPPPPPPPKDFTAPGPTVF